MKKNNAPLKDYPEPEQQGPLFLPKNRTRLISNARDLRGELEILLAVLAIGIISAMPILTSWIKKMFFSNYGIDISSSWSPFLSWILLPGFILYVIFRLISLFSAHKNPPSLRESSGSRFLDFFCEVLFFGCVIFLFVCILGYLVQISGLLLEHFLSGKMKALTGMKVPNFRGHAS